MSLSSRVLFSAVLHARDTWGLVHAGCGVRVLGSPGHNESRQRLTGPQVTADSVTWSMDYSPFLICQDGSARRRVGPEGFETLRLNTSSLRVFGKEVRIAAHACDPLTNSARANRSDPESDRQHVALKEVHLGTDRLHGLPFW